MAFRRHTQMASVLGALGVFSTLHGASALTPVCAQPAPGLQPYHGNVHAAKDAFRDNSQQYPIELFSDYAPFNDPFVCVMYEAENAGTGDILRFYWPLAGFDMDTFPYQGANKRQSVSKTITLGRLVGRFHGSTLIPTKIGSPKCAATQ
jgi:hypothetical protein